MREALAAARLYAILDLGYVPEDRLEEVAEQLLAGGADVLQLRAKGRTEEGILGMALRVQPLCHAAGVPFIVNDHPDVARVAGADGVHVGQDAGPLGELRQIAGPDLLVGRSTHSLAQATAALAEGADYIGFGPLFPTPTKAGRPGIGLEDVAEAERTVGKTIPMFCIGGIKPGNLEAVLDAGAQRIVIVSALLQAVDIATETAGVKLVLQARS